MEKVIMASGNKGKIKEAKEILDNYDVISMKDVGIDVDVVEDQKTFIGNAEKKAREIAEKINNNIVIADDSGIEIEALEGFPGVLTKRWFDGTDRERNLALIEKVNGFPREKRKVKFITAMAASNGKKTISVSSEIDGYVSSEPRGENGFGFDEIFELPNGKTLAEISDEEKNKISARKKALELLRQKIDELN